ncbi:CAZyme family GH7 [Penicillium roqueforti]|nr:CAZyme family GH7 [Penicillium roqueforti]KAI3189193.1 CAZyme family GH7 [Penicillium roqueforti]KAI3262623.1 CAZyme family GH7 [Penicillium roqueforti]KAI3280825.1 CAZyme family GH7 [Penicillium roqueforti]KAI3288428.1 CAZyme family GH7 [Penicillium roqueforti]
MASTLSNFYKDALLLVALLRTAQAQQVGTNTAEVHPSLTWQKCTTGGSCTSQSGKVVVDANWRWVHNTAGFTNCYTGNEWDTTICPDDITCATNCALEGADYSGTYGVTTSGSSLRLNFVTQASQKNIGSRLYLMADDSKYEMFQLLNQEFTFNVDVSNLPCGLNGALYFVSMDADGDMARYPANKAGAKYGTGYCDSQCPRDLKFINGQANVEGCSGDACGGTYSNDRYSGTCDPDGCDFNPYRMGNQSFYGPSKIVDTKSPFTVVTQFITNDGTSTGTLSEIKRFYVQNGKVIPQSVSTISAVTGNSISDSFCSAQKAAFGDRDVFTQHGGMVGMGAGLADGMVLVMSLWDDHAANMLWLDSTYPTASSSTTPGAARGSCDIYSGQPIDVEANNAGAYVIYSNIKVGPLGSTFSSTNSSGTTTTVTTSSTTTKATSTTTTTTSSTTGAPQYAQCGGINWTGATTCASPYTCQKQSDYYSQCL